MLTVATWNIHAGIGRDRRHDPDRTWALIEHIDGDLVGLQEVVLTDPVHDPLLERARNAGYQTHFVATRPGDRAGTQFGNLLLSRLPLTPKPPLDLSVPGREPRIQLCAEVQIDQRTLAIWVAHLGLKGWERRHQARQIHAQTQQAGVPSDRILLGDFNEWLPGRHNLRAIHEGFMRLPSPRSFPAHRPLLALDAIWLAGDLHPVHVEALRHPLAPEASDHLPIIARIQSGGASS